MRAFSNDDLPDPGGPTIKPIKQLLIIYFVEEES